MLRQRLLTGAIGGAVVIAAVMLAPVWALILLAGGIVGLAAWEWGGLAGLHRPGPKAAFAAVVGGLALLAGGAHWHGGGPALTWAWLLLAAAAWVVFALWLLAGGRPRATVARARPEWLLLGAVLMPTLVIGIAAILVSTEPQRAVLLYALVLVWVADSAAYFTGRAFGRHKLAPAVSGGKTIEGAVGGLLAALVFALLVMPWIHAGETLVLGWLLVALTVVLVSILGDLLESVLKREAGAKDSGNLLPGHGGVLDRTDSLFAALPVMAVSLAWLHWGTN